MGAPKRVRIKKIPTGAIGVSGNTNTKSTQYTGNLIYPIYKPNMMSEPEIQANHNLGPVDREDANLEAEKGETAYIPDVQGLPAHFTIGGKRHSEGGTPLNLPKDSFIYSDTAKMRIKDPNILKFFGKTGTSYTPAEIAKQYDINDYRKTLADKTVTDPIHVKTAETMIANYNKKLGKLGLVQEAMKGFPQGIPAAALPYMASNQMQPDDVLPLKGSAQGPMEDQEQPVNQGAPEEAYGGYMAEGGPKKYPYSFHAGPQPWANFGNAMMQSGGEYDAMKKKLQTIRDAEERRRTSQRNEQTDAILQNQRDREYSQLEQQMNKVKSLGEKGKYTSAFNFLPSGLEPETVETEMRALEEMSKRFGIPVGSDPNKGTTPSYGAPASTRFNTPPANKPVAPADTIKNLSEAEQRQLLGLAYGGTIPKAQDGLSNVGGKWFINKGGKTIQISDAIAKEYQAKHVKATPTQRVNTPPAQAASVKTYNPADDPQYLKNLYRQFNIVEDPYLNEKTIGKQIKSKSGKGYGDDVTLEQWKKNNPWYIEQRAKEGLPEFNPDDKSDVKHFEESLYKQNYSTLKAKGAPDQVATKLAKEMAFSDDPGDIRHADQKMGNYHKSRMAIRFKDTPADPTQRMADFAMDTEAKPGPGRIPVGPSPDMTYQTADAPWFLQDVVKTAGSAADLMRLKKYLPWARPVSPYVPDPTFYDPTRELAANAEAANIATQGAGAFGDPRQFGANAMAIQGQGAKAAADVLGRYNNLNVGVANQFSQMKAGVFNQANQANADQAKELFDKTTMANQQFDNSKAMAREQLRSSYIDAVTNRANAQVLNTLYPNYQIDPSTGGMLDFYKGDPLHPSDVDSERKRQADYFDFVKSKDPSATWKDVYGREKGDPSYGYATGDPNADFYGAHQRVMPRGRE